MNVDEPSDVDDLAEYWGRGGRKVDIRPVLEAAANDKVSHAADVTYLLPDLPRLLLYHYQKIGLSDLEKSGLENCCSSATSSRSRTSP